MNKREIIERLKNIARYAVHTVGEEPFVMSLDDGIAVHEAIELLEKIEPLTDNEQAIDYLRETGWLQNHDRILTESKIMSPVQSERKTGRWISLDDFRGKYNENGFMCSECDEHSDYEENFCPNCGADMRGGKDGTD